ncbi:hypothetical protein Slin15195_G043970 [Septoria linicola]|uniref:Uncharacterized protein n=1 Tax=Septoria linicola TaxID=215465 RepID=A0A9Q9EJ79_9PEZI|nr:hypothetical protein Slin14017_G047490 [Septoria linicola]USW51078.1 hypothetical protein Slin15195_G043970 [Septoria linicola]
MESPAVARVLGIVELLEIILRHLPVKIGYRGRHSRAAHAQVPVLQLFQLRRVDRKWQGTIDGSLKLRQHMGLEGPIAAPPDHWQRWIGEQYAPFLWFLDLAGISIDFMTDTTIYMSETVRCQSLRPAHIHFWERLVCPRMSRALAASLNASWRGIRLSAVKDAPDITFHLRIEEVHPHWRVHWQYRIQQGATLGRFYDNLCQAIEGFRRKHRKIELNGQFEERLTAWTRIELRHGYHYHRGEMDLQKCVICQSSPEDIPPATNPPPLSALTSEAFSVPAIIEGVLVHFQPTNHNGSIPFLITESVQPVTRPFAL